MRPKWVQYTQYKAYTNKIRDERISYLSHVISYSQETYTVLKRGPHVP